MDKYVKELLKDSKKNVIDIGCSGDSVTEIIKKDNIYYMKESKSGKLDREYYICHYLKDKLPVPEVAYFLNTNDESILITKKLPGEMICSDDIFDNMHRVIELAAQGIKMLQSINIDDLTIINSLDKKLAVAKYNLDKKLVNTSDMNESNIHKFGSIENAYNYLINNKIEESDLCFSHGDLSLPNIFYENDRITGFLDLGEAGIADKWYDIAILVKSLRRNYKTDEAEKYLFKCLDIKPNYEKIEYYILLTELFL